MSKLVPLHREGASDLEQQLLDAARHDVADDDAARARSLAAAKAVLQAGAVVGAATAGVAGWRWATALGLTTTKAAWLGGVGLVVVLGSAGLVAGVGSTQVAPRPALSASPLVASVAKSPPSQVAVPPILEVPPAAESAPAPVAEVPSPPAAVGKREAPRLATPPSAPASGVAAAPPVSAPTPALLGAETALLQSARSSLAASHPSEALAELDRYNAQFPTGILAEEAAAVRVEALVASGRLEDARRVGQDFEHRFPKSPILPRVRALLASGR